MAEKVPEPIRFDDLPCEIIEYVLRRSAVSIQDVVRFGSVCTYFQSVVRSSKDLWRIKFSQAWPRLYTMLTRHLGQEDFDWHAQCQLRLSIPRRAGPHLQVLSAVYFEQPSCLVWYHEIPELMAVADLAPSAPFHLWDYFLEVLDDGYPDENLTLKYYTREAVRELVQQFHWVIMPEWSTLLRSQRSVESVPPELPMALAAQWMKAVEYVDFEEKVVRRIDETAAEIMSAFAARYPSHWSVEADHGLWKRTGVDWTYVGPRTGDELKALWLAKRAESSMFKLPTAAENEKIMEFVMSYLVGTQGWRTEKSNGGTQGFIHDALVQKRGWTYILAVVFCAIGLRFGVICRMRFDVVGVMPLDEAGVVWYDHQLKTNAKGRQELVSNLGRGEIIVGGAVVWRSFSVSVPDKEIIVTVAEVRQAIVKVLQAWRHSTVGMIVSEGQKRCLMSCLKSIRTLMALVERDESRLYDIISSVFRETQLYKDGRRVPFIDIFHPNFFSTWDTPEAIVGLTNAYLVGRQERDDWTLRRYDIDHCRRVEYLGQKYCVKYAVGMIMHHKRFDYIGVIYRWDPVCLASSDWQSTMRVDQLSEGSLQPFYGVLVSDGSERYVAQENLELVSPPLPRITNPEVPRYFKEYCGLHYEPNEQLHSFYGDDGPTRTAFVERLRNGL